MKKAFTFILGMVCFVAIILAGAENMDGSCNVKWTLSWMAVATVSGLILSAINKKDNNTKKA